jgi:hypothetical protein
MEFFNYCKDKDFNKLFKFNKYKDASELFLNNKSLLHIENNNINPFKGFYNIEFIKYDNDNNTFILKYLNIYIVIDFKNGNIKIGDEMPVFYD